jgi:hypothetical protein
VKSRDGFPSTGRSDRTRAVCPVSCAEAAVLRFSTGRRIVKVTRCTGSSSGQGMTHANASK